MTAPMTLNIAELREKIAYTKELEKDQVDFVTADTLERLCDTYEAAQEVAGEMEHEAGTPESREEAWERGELDELSNAYQQAMEVWAARLRGTQEGDGDE